MTEKRMYVIQTVDYDTFYCGMSHWNKQLHKAKIYHSLKYAREVVKYHSINCKILEVTMSIVGEVNK